MPKPSIKTDLDVIISDFADLKVFKREILADFEAMYTIQLNRFREFAPADILEDLEYRVQVAKKYKLKPKTPNRLYLLTMIYYPELILENVEGCVLKHMDQVLSLSDKIEPDYIPLEHNCTVFLFTETSKYPRYWEVFPKTAMEFIRCFAQDNLLSNSKIRDCWYGGPRRQARKGTNCFDLFSPETDDPELFV